MDVAPPQSSSGVDDMCHCCSKIDIARLVSVPCDGPILGQIARTSRGSCILCDFFFGLLPAQAKEGQYIYYNYRLRSTWSCDYQAPNPRKRDRVQMEQGCRNPEGGPRCLNETWPAVHVIVLRLHPVPNAMKEILDGPGIPSILPRTSASSWFKPLTSRVDFDVPKRWLQLCSSLHKCHRLIEEVGPSRLIDCNARVIIPTGQTANSAYVTLSYVWGSSAKDDTASIPALETTSWILPEELPKTIEDAITVTQELGYRYLWVDKYCIDQSRSEDFISQVQQMDLIYRNSVLTIIDAAGHDPFKGLPGVRPDSRSPIQPSVSVGDYELYSTMHRPEWDIKTSRWSTRAWTYQEGLLSRRRLIFTAQQMYFECQGVYCKEALDFPTDGLQELHLDSPKKGHSLHEDFRRANGMGVFPFRLIGANVWEIYARMTEYSGRSLTRDDDILNGILGLFRYTGRTRYPIINLWGLPYRLKAPIISGYKSSKDRLPTFNDSLRWTKKEPSVRRAGFPSWSWCGWYGQVQWPSDFDPFSQQSYTSCERELPEMKIKIKSATENWGDINRSYEQLAPVIRIPAMALIADRLDPENDDALFKPRFNLLNDRFSSNDISCSATTTDLLDKGQDYLAVLLADSFHRPYCSCAIMDGDYRCAFREFLIVRKMGNVWERVAIGSLKVPMDVIVSWDWPRRDISLA